jgi:histidyl-tRNA synthetase
MGLGPGHVQLHLNDRRVLNAVLDHLGVPAAQHLPVMVVMDKRDKVGAEELDRQLIAQGLTAGQVAALNRFLRMESLEQVREALGGVPAVEALARLLERLEGVGFGGYCRFDVTVVRGLSYYTGTVFEIRDAGSRLRAICGGGRYDSLLSTFGGEPIPAIGFGFGDVVILELLGDLELLPLLSSQVDFAVIPFSQAEHDVALRVSQAVRRAGLRADADFSNRKLKRALQRADEIGARRAVLLMPEELARGELVLRDMAKREERRVALAEFLAHPQ